LVLISMMPIFGVLCFKIVTFEEWTFMVAT
jgi:hypothetical protein